MEFRPCIDIHNGKVKQIVGGSLSDAGNYAKENFVSGEEAPYFADLYKKDGITGGHVIMLNARNSEYYEKTKAQAMSALRAYPSGLMVGGGIDPENAEEFLSAGASHVIVTSYVFQKGKIRWEALEQMKQAVGADRLVLDLSCRKRDGHYYVVTDRWQTFTEEILGEKLLSELSGSCDEFLIHGVDVEGKGGGLDPELITLLSAWKGIPITYAGGISSFFDLETLRALGQGRIHATIGSALDLFGGTLPYAEVVAYFRRFAKPLSDEGGSL